MMRSGFKLGLSGDLLNINRPVLFREVLKCAISSQPSTSDAARPTFRQKYELHSSFDRFHWFPRHMYSGVKAMEGKLRKCDCVLEVHDARIPFSGRNSEVFKPFYQLKPHILILNKSDLIAESNREYIEDRLKAEANVSNVMWTNFKKRGPAASKRVIKKITEMVTTSERYHRDDVHEFECLVVGIPNVGKSTLINQLRVQALNTMDDETSVADKKTSRKKLKGPLIVGDLPGVTKAVHHRIRVSGDPDIYLMDTPGVLPPTRVDPETIMKMAVCRCVQEGDIDRTQSVADYLLYWLNKNHRFEYVDVLKMSQATDSIETLLLNICAKKNLTVKRVIPGEGQKSVPDFARAAEQFLAMFRTKKLGDSFMDIDL